MKNILNQNVAELGHYIKSSIQRGYVLWQYRNFSLASIFLGPLKASLLRLI